jgi:hypothetical protein
MIVANYLFGKLNPDFEVGITVLRLVEQQLRRNIEMGSPDTTVPAWAQTAEEKFVASTHTFRYRRTPLPPQLPPLRFLTQKYNKKSLAKTDIFSFILYCKL